MDYLALVNDNQREDSYVNATKWCSAFGKRLNNWRRSKGTWVHPMVALALAEWWSPEFHVLGGTYGN